MFWVIVETVRILILKLGSSFWLLPNNVDNPAHLFSLITENELYLELFEKSSMADFGGVQVRILFHLLENLTLLGFTRDRKL